MNSREHASQEATRSRDVSNTTSLDRRTTASTYDSNQRHSFASSETGESSRAASNRGSLTTEPTDVVDEDVVQGKGGLDLSIAARDGKGSHRSHRSKGSGGFLLSHNTFEPPSQELSSKTIDEDNRMRQRPSTRDRKGKTPVRSPEKRHTKTKSGLGLRVQSSPLSTNVTSAPATGGLETAPTHKDNGGNEMTEDKVNANPLDVDSAQIVSLALNLNESRRNAARRNVSTPLPPLTPGFTEGFAGGSLRHHLQQQRRVSRNISPKPARGERAVTASPRITSAQRLASPLQPAFDPQGDGGYRYQFSASTLARAEKAKTAIELMAQYRRVLLYVPPLKPQGDRMGGSDRGNSSEATTSAPTSRVASSTYAAPLPLGRPYNPLQYVRNRKMRLRTGRAINGEEQGFGDLAKVSSWVDQVLTEASSAEYQAADCLPMPPFSKAAKEAASPHTSPSSNHGKGHSSAPKVKRPRNDWIIDPKDLLADLYWLEQEDNKKFIEDSHGRKIFPQQVDLKRPISKQGNGNSSQFNFNSRIKDQASGLDLYVDTKMPEFMQIKAESDKHSDGAVSKAKDKLRQVRHAAGLPHGNNGSAQPGRQTQQYISRSDSDSADSSQLRRSRRKRSGTADSNDLGTDILEKQMMEMLARENEDGNWNLSESGTADTREKKSTPSHTDGVREPAQTYRDRSASQDTSGSIVNKHQKRDSLVHSSSGRASLEVPMQGGRPRRSLDEFDSTAPSSPEARPFRTSNAFVPTVELSHAQSRHASPSRTPLSKVKNKINQFHDSHHKRVSLDEPPRLDSSGNVPETPSPGERRKRSISPFKSSSSKKTDESARPALKNTGSVRRSKLEESGIKGLFKGRNPVSRVGDFVWKTAKEQIPGLSSGYSSDDSELDEPSPPSVRPKKDSNASSVGAADDNAATDLPKERATYTRDLPTFTSPFEGRGRTIRNKNTESTSSSDPLGRESKKAIARSTGLEPPPRIDIQSASPTSSPDPNGSNRRKRDSSVSDTDISRRQSLASGSRLNEILGSPGHRRNALPMTGLANLEVTNDRTSIDSQRQWSISDRAPSVHRGPMSKREIARVRALLLSSGIKAKEITRRAAEPQDLNTTTDPHYAGISKFAHAPISPVPKSQQHNLAAHILETDIHNSSEMWQASTDHFIGTSIQKLFDDINALRSKVNEGITNMARTAADEADEVSKDLVTSQTLAVKAITDKMDTMMRRRRRRFRWLRQGVWVVVEWALVGVMWYVWFLVVLVRVVRAVWMGGLGW
ncbi:hypothetical protein GLAREA_04315 [Glarea lozoyensis ATCC 20868]|uniref:Uncharacterized protein n=1 Tax=Glarea lozoyensis (strain ATCC 20868 / MF5171) TaxID=1116229 RepID=S3CQX9_GLAL2|nr:uncharacterized protein GLAREA_04315 [Glarea lozoyensis ATCC 20868]EPE27524.1 hypothetical protein GLAREA_04315 [Glarea lozoyensis ATCC 20868]